MRASVGRAFWTLALPGLGLLALAGCAQLPAAPRQAANPAAPEHALKLVPTPFAKVPGWGDDRQAEALATFLGSCRALGAMPAETPLGGAPGIAARVGSAGLWRPVCE